MAVSAVSGAADTDAGEDEAAREQREALPAEREADIADEKAGGSRAEDPQEAVAVADMAGGDARERRGKVVAGVEHERELRRGCV